MGCNARLADAFSNGQSDVGVISFDELQVPECPGCDAARAEARTTPAVLWVSDWFGHPEDSQSFALPNLAHFALLDEFQGSPTGQRSHTGSFSWPMSGACA